ncbi:MAG: hypothetical protein NC078_07300 [Ruminococcus sp.]|nr:hypothetical protein [Ruminococcus sp.]
MLNLIGYVTETVFVLVFLGTLLCGFGNILAFVAFLATFKFMKDKHKQAEHFFLTASASLTIWAALSGILWLLSMLLLMD